MDDALTQLEEWAAPLLAKLEPSARLKLARQAAQALAKSQRRRIARQRNPDGSQYAPRRPRGENGSLRAQRGRVRRRAMFMKIRQAKYLKAEAKPDAILVGFIGKTASIARIHQYGLRNKVDEDGPTVDYPQRVLLGYSAEDLEMLRDFLIDHLTEDLP